MQVWTEYKEKKAWLQLWATWECDWKEFVKGKVEENKKRDLRKKWDQSWNSILKNCTICLTKKIGEFIKNIWPREMQLKVDCNIVFLREVSCQKKKKILFYPSNFFFFLTLWRFSRKNIDLKYPYWFYQFFVYIL